ncbi:DUF3857 domain-containing protein [Rufibacter glacialis]|uniref:DUF3857 domain-containing protein n=1 Tax=Rufibacter glacialis TaxID=1259555 RepID=A0A5M8QBS2_9BACT|nr:DUF3857 domain-containing protein [Rufibacter glacialis]KAA6433455.1 DUF3857 domain-containing protein [Rufibacter glacialis]GGK74069.1 hypothetical protein GCM10011405_22650 [Rufibacter glacialis]
MQKRLIALLLSLLAGAAAWAGDTPTYAAFTINPALSKGADAVIRTEETTFTVHSAKSASQKIRAVVTVLNEDGKKHARLVVRYDKLEKVDFIKGTVYDAMGKKAGTLKASDIKDYSDNGEGTLFGDNRVKVAVLAHVAYPYTVEYEYQTTTSNMLFYPFWYPISAEKVAVEQASFQVNMPAGLELRYKEAHLPEPGKVAQEGNQKVYRWQVKALAPVEEEPYGPDLIDMVPAVKTAPTAFEVEGYAGTMQSWQTLGEFHNKLNQGRDQLPEQTKQQILALTKDIANPKEKIKAVYQFMQNKTRYVSIQLGIGGWQPFEATMVDSKGYGDCKALSNYTKALLDVAGIPSHYAIIYGGADNRPVMKDFPSRQFNHVVLCVPMAKDTVWLECTSQTDDAGYTGSNTGDRYSLLVTPEGGKLVATPRFTALDNTQKRAVQVKLNAQGAATGEVFTRFTGIQHEGRSHIIQSYKPDEQLKWLYRNTQIPAFEIKNYQLEKVKDEPQVKEKLQLVLPKLASVSGKRLFITPNLMNRWTSVPAVSANRKQDVIWPMSFHDVDSVEYELPAGYKAENMPKPVKIASAFGEYQAQVQIQGTKLIYVRQLTMHKSRHSAEKYMELVNFLKQVSRADQQQVVLAAETT